MSTILLLFFRIVLLVENLKTVSNEVYQLDTIRYRNVTNVELICGQIKVCF